MASRVLLNLFRVGIQIHAIFAGATSFQKSLLLENKALGVIKHCSML